MTLEGIHDIRSSAFFVMTGKPSQDTKSTKPSKPLTSASTGVAQAVNPATTNDTTNGPGTPVVEGPHVMLTPYQRMQQLLRNTASETDKGPVVVNIGGYHPIRCGKPT
ncbi:unnamed protein product [Phytophthora lilii]|uniref:Unnamed protein product n=1 Tax=Phytophthora lilii TaxID=2077276 RepID=A0A9W6U1G9_9STRA|nr:unnamed protein product [Phytophthora lilii]